MLALFCEEENNNIFCAMRAHLFFFFKGHVALGDGLSKPGIEGKKQT